MLIQSSQRRTISKLLIAIGLMVPLMAHAGLMQQVQDLLGSNISPNDESMSMLKKVFGDFILDPFGQSASASSGNVLGDMFKSYNMFIFSAAMIWFAYTSFASLAQTMHEGVVLGRRMSTVWMPIRVTFGAASLMPVFGGWAFCQALMVIASTCGIAGANLIAKTAVSGTGNFQVMVNPVGSVKQASQLRNLEYMLLTSAACSISEEILNAEKNTVAGTSLPTRFEPSINSTNSTISMEFPGNGGRSACGTVNWKFSPRNNNALGLGNMFGFRIEGVQYEAIRTVAMNSHRQTMRAVYQDARKIVEGATAKEPNAPQFLSAVELLQKGYFGSYNQVFQAQLREMTVAANGASNVQAVSQQLLQRMQEGGWATLGIWYGVFAEVNEAMNEMLDPIITFTEAKATNSSVESDVVAGLDAAIATAKSVPAKFSDNAADTGTRSATGNFSIGQYIMGGIVDMTYGASSTGASDNINPIIAFKNIGDNALGIAETILIAVKGAELLTETTALGKVVKAGAGMASKIPGLSFISDMAGQAGGLIVMAAYMLFAAAAVMAFYIPMLPFIQWFAGLLQWFTSVVESLVGSSLWALAHFDSDGEGMGQRASYGYLYMLNNFARPIVMTFAFFIASACISVLGTFLFKYFGSAVASAQGNSVHGLISIGAYLIILAVLGITLINGSLTIMLQMADRVIGWIGQNASANIGHEVENKVNHLFMTAASSSARALTPKATPPGLATAGNRPGGNNLPGLGGSSRSAPTGAL